MRTTIRRRVAVILAFIALNAVLFLAWGHRRPWIEHTFRVVEPGRVYAGGYQDPGPLARIIKRHQIKTVLSLLAEGSRGDSKEQEIAAAHGVRFVQVAIPFANSAGEKFLDTKNSHFLRYLRYLHLLLD